MNTIDSLKISKSSAELRSEFSEGLVYVDRVIPEALSFPVQVALVSADVSDKPQLETLYPMASIADYSTTMLRPSGLDPSIFSGSSFRDVLASMPQQLQLLAWQHRSDSRKLGRLAQVMSRQDDLFRLAQMYASALVQG